MTPPLQVRRTASVDGGAVADAEWRRANREWLAASVTLLREDLAARHHAAEGPELDGQREIAVAQIVALADSMSAPPALDALALALGLTRFERQIVLLCAGTELDGDLASLCAEVHGSAEHYSPTFSLALAHLDDPHWDATAPTAPLRGWHLIDVADTRSLTLAPLRLDERVLHHLTGHDYLDPVLGAHVPSVDARALVPSLAAQAVRIAEAWSPESEAGARAIGLWGPRDERVICAAAAADRLGITLAVVDATRVPMEAAALERFARHMERELLLSDTVFMIECDSLEAKDGDRVRAIERLGDDVMVPLVFASDDRLSFAMRRRVLNVTVSLPTRGEQRRLWRTFLDDALAPDGVGVERADGRVTVSEIEQAIDNVVGQFDLGPSAISAAACDAVELATGPIDDADYGFRGAALGRALWESCRVQARTGISGIAQRLECRASWNDLVLPTAQAGVLHDIVGQVRHRTTVYDDWGFAERLSRGLGVTALFAGPSGTGKTMAAEVIAGELGLDLYVVDLSTVMDKFIGETEKNLRRVFDASERSGAVLLFDEADALFGRRSEVRDSHDRYANIGVSYLLTRMETYRGLAILTTNRRDALDEAFVRRLRFIVRFPFPDAEQRRLMWEKAFPLEAPTDCLDADALAEHDVSGAMIRNIAMNAAFAAADVGSAITMSQVYDAMRDEYAKSERTFSGPLTERGP